MSSSASSPPLGRRPFRGVSADERQARRRQQLIDAALELFGTRGFHAVGVRDICSEAHLTERYFYESFPNREALFLAVYEHAVAQVRDAITRAMAGSDASPERMARTILRAYLEALQAEPRLARVILIDVLTVSADVGSRSMAASRSFSDMLVPILSELYPKLAERRMDARLVADGLVGSTLFISAHWAFNDFSEPIERILEHCALLYDATHQVLS